MCTISLGSNLMIEYTICIAVPIPKVAIRVPMPTGPPRRKPIARTATWTRIWTAPIGTFGSLFPTPTKKCISGAAALASRHIDPHTYGNKNETDKHDKDSHKGAVLLWQRVVIIKELNVRTAEECVKYSSEADVFLHENVYDKDHYGNDGHTCAVVKWQMI